jgi:MauM/NapG family ferredoxin protein
VAISAFFSAIHKKIFLFSIVTVVLTLILGRFFCGWVCPLGTLNQAISYFNKKLLRVKKTEPYHPGQKIKYLVFIFLLVLILLGLNWMEVFDPLSFLSRGMVPIFSGLVSKFFQFLQYLNTHISLFSNDRFFYGIQAYVNYFYPHFFRYATITSFVLIAVLILNSVVSRFWCRLICPLGGLLGLFSLPGILNLEQRKKCQNCFECIKNCQGACDPHKKGEWKKQECLYCWNCVVSCPENNLGFRFTLQNKDFQRIDLSRRQFVLSSATAVVALPVIKTGYPFERPHARLIRPPGASEEVEFLRRCIRCSQCIKVCPTNFLHPTLMEAGLEGLWTPYGVGSLGYCKYDCNLCGRVCPTGAIQNLDLIQKQKTKIGTAFVEQGRCLPYAFGIACRLCYEHCPVPGKAIYLKEIVNYDRYGMPHTLEAPVVEIKKCIGCGRCENVCPVTSLPAIYCTNTGEYRCRQGRLLLIS